MKRMALALALLATPALAQQGTPGAHFLQNWDLDGDGKVTVAEAETRRSDVFLSFDADEDGFLDADEYTLFDEARATDMAAQSAQDRGAMMRAADGMKLTRNDTDGDGKVSREEFVAGAAGWVAQMDSDGDGAVTVADFGPGRAGRMGQGQGTRLGMAQGMGHGMGQGMGQGMGHAMPKGPGTN